MASSQSTDMILDNENSRDGGSVASTTPAPTPAQTPSPPMPLRAPLHSDPTRPPHLCQPCTGDHDGFCFPGPGPAPAQAVRYERSFSSDSAVMTELPTPPSPPVHKSNCRGASPTLLILSWHPRHRRDVSTVDLCTGRGRGLANTSTSTASPRRWASGASARTGRPCRPCRPYHRRPPRPRRSEPGSTRPPRAKRDRPRVQNLMSYGPPLGPPIVKISCHRDRMLFS